MTEQQITIIQPDDWHLHLRDNGMLKSVLPYTSKQYARAIIMPNLVPPIRTLNDIENYRQKILAALPNGDDFIPLMTAYLSENMDINALVNGFKQHQLTAIKLYPAHATTNSAYGVKSIDSVMPILEAMAENKIPLLIHGEATDSSIDVFDREAKFIESTLLPLMAKLPSLKIVLEHITTKEAAQLILEGPANLAATVTPQHLLLNRNALFQGGIRPHHYCLPILKRESHREFLTNAVTSGCTRFFLGTDSAPHEQTKKESMCGCAGIFNAPVALAVYTQIFEQQNALDKLEGFTSLNGPNFYNLPTNTKTITLVKKSQTIPKEILLPNGSKIIPFLAGETLNWSVLNKVN